MSLAICSTFVLQYLALPHDYPTKDNASKGEFAKIPNFLNY